jgi:hypothetical protein
MELAASQNATGGIMLQTMLYLVNYNYTKSFVDSVYNFPNGPSQTAGDEF